MNFCEGCNIATEDSRCPNCERKKLRTVTESDFCLAGKVDRIFGENLKDNLAAEDIDCVLMPYGSGVHSQFALPLESRLVYVRYPHLSAVRQIINGHN